VIPRPNIVNRNKCSDLKETSSLQSIKYKESIKRRARALISELPDVKFSVS
jgi:hypothetical protein